MNSSIVILDSDEEVYVTKSGNKNVSRQQNAKTSSIKIGNDDLDEFADITAPDDHDDTFLHSLGLPTVSTKELNYVSQSQRQLGGQNKITSTNIICIDDDDNVNDQDEETRSYIDLSRINDFPSSPKVTFHSDYLISSDEEILVTSVEKPKPIVELATKSLSNSFPDANSTQNSYKGSSLKHLPKNWSNKPKSFKKTRSESDVTSSSIGIIHVPSQKPQYTNNLESIKSQQTDLVNSYYQSMISRNSPKSSPSTCESPKISRISQIASPLINKAKKLDYSFSNASNITSSMHDASLDFSNDEIKQMKKAMKMREKQKLENVKSIISDLRKARTGNHVNKAKASMTYRNTVDTSLSDISNTSIELKRNNDSFMEEVMDSIGSYTDSQLDAMFEKAKTQDPQGLRRVNQTLVGKDVLTARTTCCFSSCLDESLKKINVTYHTHIKPANFEVFEDHIIPMIKFKRYVDAVYYKAKSTMVPCKPRHVSEDFVILVYEAENLLDMFDRCVIQKHIKSIKMKNPKTKFAVWILKYDQYLLQLRNKANRLHKKQVMESLGPIEDAPRKKRKKSVEGELMIHPSDIIQKLLKYEIQYDFSFQSLKGLSDLIDWLMAIAYTLSSKHVDYIERNDEFMNLGKVKSGNNTKECLTIMMAQLKGVSEQRAKSFVTNGGYSCIGEVFEDVMKEVDFTANKLLRNDNVKILEKLMKASNGDEAIT